MISREMTMLEEAPQFPMNIIITDYNNILFLQIWGYQLTKIFVSEPAGRITKIPENGGNENTRVSQVKPSEAEQQVGPETRQQPRSDN